LLGRDREKTQDGIETYDVSFSDEGTEMRRDREKTQDGIETILRALATNERTIVETGRKPKTGLKLYFIAFAAIKR